ncbi:sensor histidine kinase [Pseudorhodoferax sp. Leaf267]|uniref:sensor histidine kinase n=1 Tax=Pseudorhodoferax sp. Leaf267 TaxID=1736316 RepID=UPI0009E9C0C0|nr:histidine kinase [Pseudorhodoferax sp. Leaf267]
MATMLPPDQPPAFSLQALARHGLVNAAFCCLVAAGLALTTDKSWDQQLVYSLAIGMTSWLVIDLGRLVVRKPSDQFWPSGLRGAGLVLVGITIGFLAGSTVGDWYCGCSTWGPAALGSHRLTTSLVITFFAGLAGSYFFHSRGKQNAQEARIALAERDALQARLQLLQAQLEPHMLFNTLANLRALVGTDPAQATRMLDHLVAYLRATLVASRATEHSLAQEFDRLRDYLELMAVRMGPRLRYTLELPAELADWPVPSLLLQPLVENSIRHGLEPQVEGGSIRVSARASAAGVELEVLDSGTGMDEGSGQQAQGGTGFGLVGVHERLATQFGPRAALVVAPAPEGGTTARITLPATARPAAGARAEPVTVTGWTADRTREKLHTR